MDIINSIDDKIYSLISQHINPGNTAIMTFISNLGETLPIIAIAVAVILILLILKKRKDPICIATNLALVAGINLILKEIIRRPRPNILRLIPETGYSFPSAHAMVAIGFYGFFIYLICKKVKNKAAKYSAAVILSLLIFFIGISRIYLGVHYATDVIGGWIIGFICLLLFIKYIYNNKKWSKLK